MTPQYIQQPHIAISATTMDRHLFLRPCGIGVFIKEAAAAIFLVLFLKSRAIHAFNPSPITTTPLLTRLQNIQCELALSVGRIPGTAMVSCFVFLLVSCISHDANRSQHIY